MPRVSRRSASVGLLATALVVAGLIPVLTALASSPAPRDQVHPRHLPSHSQVAALYPGLDGGARQVVSSATVDVRTADCLFWRPAVEANSGRWAYYLGASRSTPASQGLPDPEVHVYKFVTVPQARQAFRTVRRSIVQCAGTASDRAASVTARTVKIPRLGAGRVAQREVEVEQVDGVRTEQRTQTIWVRKNTFLVSTTVSSPTPAALRKQVRLTRVTLRLAR
jgi:hypothetical protein